MIILDLIEHSKLEEQYGTTELDQLLFTIRFKTAWMHQNFIWLNEFNREFSQNLKQELELHNITGWKNQENYDKLISEAEVHYASSEYQKSASKYKEAFEQVEPYLSDRYNAACSYGLARDIESAFSQLFIMAGGKFKYADYERITDDPDFDVLHQDKRWNELLAIIKSNRKEIGLE